MRRYVILMIIITCVLAQSPQGKTQKSINPKEQQIQSNISKNNTASTNKDIDNSKEIPIQSKSNTTSISEEQVKSLIERTIGESSIPTAQIGQKVKGIAYKVDQGRSFHLFNVPTLEKKYLFFSLLLDPIYSHMPVNMSIFKQSAQTPLKICPKEEVDSCYISKQILEQNETLLVAIQAGSECQYAIKSYWSDIQHIKVNEQVKFMFSKTDQKQLYHLQLDQSMNFQFLKIIIKPQTRRDAFDQIKLYGTFGRQSLPSSTNYDFKSISLWQDAQGVYLTKSQLKDSKMHIILLGSTETIYTMSCTVSNKTYNQLTIGDRQYDYLDRVAPHHDYHINFNLPSNQTEYQQYLFRVAIFSGDLTIQFYSDQQKTTKIKENPPFMYMGDIQYIFFGQEVKSLYPQGIYIKLFPKNVSTTYMVQFQGRGKDNAIQMHEHIYEFIPIKNKRQTAYFKISKFSQAKSTVQNINVVFSMVTVIGKVGVQFFRCTQSEKICLNNLHFKQNQQKIKVQQREVGQKTIFSFNLTNDFWRVVNIAEKDAVIIVILSSLGKEESFAACEFNVGNRPQFLRSNKPIESHIYKNDFKIYKYSTQDKQVNKVKVFINKIKGSFKTLLLRSEPDIKNLNSTLSYESDSTTYQVIENITNSPIVIVVMGIQSSTYSIIAQPIHNELAEINSITLSEDIEFKIKINPNQYQIFQIIPIQSNIFFNYKATGALHVCILNKDNLCLSSNQTLFFSSGQVNIPNFSQRSLLIKIRNPSHSKIVQVVSKFHSKNLTHCQYRQLGVFYQQSIKEGQCLSTIMNGEQDYEIIILREEQGSLNYNMFLCDKLLNYARKQNGEERYIITKQQININCKEHSQFIFSFIVSGDKNKTLNTNNASLINLKYMIQSTNGVILLPDGIAFHGSEIVFQYKVKSFAYSLINKQDTTIILQSATKLSIIAFVIDQKKKDKIRQIEEDYKTYKFVSKSQNNELVDIRLKLSKQNLQQYKCQKCLLIVNVYSVYNINGEKVTYTIQVTQNFMQLEQGQQKKGLLLKNSVAYYSYNAKKGSISIEAADNNQQCTQIFLGITQYPNSKTSIQRSVDGHLLFDNLKPQMLYISVKAKKLCTFYISVSSSQNGHNILKLKKGSIGQINLAEGGFHYFTFKHNSQNPFKIYTLIKYGSLSMYLNQTTTKGISLLMKQPAIAHSSFSIRSDKSSQIYLDSSSPQFCKGCFYILAVQAIKQTEASIIVADEETKIPLSDQKVLNDYLLKVGSQTQGQIFITGNIILQLHVQKGMLQLNIDLIPTPIAFNVTQSQLPIQYNLTLGDNNLNIGGTVIRMTALHNETIYSLRIRQVRQDVKQQIKIINTVQPNYINIKRNIRSCMSGFFKEPKQHLIISFSKKYKDEAKALVITGKINGNDTKIAYEFIHNVITVTYVLLQSGPAVPFVICLKNQLSSMPVTLIQSGHIFALPQNIQNSVVKEQIFDIYPEKDFLLDLFECSGKALYSYGYNLQQLQQAKPKLFQALAMPEQTHAARISVNYNNVLLKISSPFALVRWININEEQEKGIGYYIYKAGKAKYNSLFGKVDFTIQKLITTRKTNTILDKVVYSLYVSNSEDELRSATMCEINKSASVLVFRQIHQTNSSTLSNDTNFTFEIQKIYFSQSYSKDKNLFYSIVADATILLPTKQIEDYKFIYNSQQLPSELFYPSQLQSYDLKIVIAAILLFIIAVIVFTYSCTRIIIPMIGKFRYSVMIDQQNKEEEDQVEKSDGTLEPPPSSDRNISQEAQTSM